MPDADQCDDPQDLAAQQDFRRRRQTPARGDETVDEARCWLSQPEEWQPLFRRWHREFPERTRLHVWPQMGGQEVVALTIGRADVLAGGAEPPPFRLLAAVPHGHEPAPTAAAVDVASQLLRGTHVDGSPSALPAETILASGLVTLLPDTNAQGRSRAPVRCWDGSTYDNPTFWKYAFGIAADGERFGRYPEWRLSEHRPLQVGVIYEQIEPDVYVEPNTSRRSTYARATDELFGQYRYTHLLEMHQHEWPEAPLLSADFEALPAGEQEHVLRWAGRLVAEWRAVGVEPSARPAIPYRGQPRQQFFLDFWRGRCPGMLRLNSEVRNNRLEPGGGVEETPLARQFRTALAPLEATLGLAVGA